MPIPTLDSYTMNSAYNNIPMRRYLIVVLRIVISYVQLSTRFPGIKKKAAVFCNYISLQPDYGLIKR